MIILQELVHRVQNISQAGRFKALLVLMAAILLAVIYDLRNYRNLATQEAMDNAQLARNIARGRGFTTEFVRPFSLYLLKRASEKSSGAGGTNAVVEALLSNSLPDISNPPLYPCVLAGLFKVTNPNFEITPPDKRARPFWGNLRDFLRYKPDFLITILNQFLLLIVIALSFLWARKLFDSTVAWSSAVILLVTENLWRFSVSGLPTLLLILIFMLVVWCLTLLEIEAREPRWKPQTALILSGVTGVLLGFGTLTCYSFGWLLLPVVAFIVFITGAANVKHVLAVAIAFAVVTAPWLVRNYALSGTPFGTASYTAITATDLFPGHQLARALAPNIFIVPGLFWSKLFTNLHAIRQQSLFNIGTGWASALFLVGLLLPFRNNTLRLVRYWLLASLLLLILVQASVRTQLSTDSPDINSENLLVLLLPLVVIYAISLFYTLLDRLQLPPFELRLLIGFFGLLSALPMLLAVVRSETTPLVYPPYHPAVIQEIASWTDKDELLMSDVPWALAWYGDRQSIWLTLDAVPDPENPSYHEHFMTVNNEFKHISALYLTPLTIDVPLLSDCVRTHANSWGKFVLSCLVEKRVLENFPLYNMPTEFLPEQIFLSDTRRWRGEIIKPEPPPTNPLLQPSAPGGGESKDDLRRKMKRTR